MNGKRRMGLAVAAVVVGLAQAGMADDFYWNVAQGGWNEEGNWRNNTNPPTTSAKVPTAADVAYIANSGKATIDNEVSVGSMRINNGDVIIAEDGSLLVEGFAGSNSGLMIGFASNTVGVLTQLGGEISFGGTSNRQVFIGRSGTGTYNLVDGTLDLTNTTEIAIARESGSTGRFFQSGGTVKGGGHINGADKIVYIALNGPAGAGQGALWEVSGGVVDLYGPVSGNNFWTVGLQAGATFRVKGSAASITISNFRDLGSESAGRGDFEFVLDNSAGHISAINSPNTSYDLFGHLKVSLDGGVMLAGATSFDLVRAGGFDSGKPMFHSYPTAGTSLWDTVKGTTTVSIVLDSGAKQGDLDLEGVSTLAFAPAAYGYVNLLNVDLAQPLEVLLDVEGGDLLLLQEALSDAKVQWDEGEGNFDLKLVLNPAVSGGTYFAWDFGGIDPDMALQGISVGVVPEPVAMSLAVVGAGMVMLGRRGSVRRS